MSVLTLFLVFSFVFARRIIFTTEGKKIFFYFII